MRYLPVLCCALISIRAGGVALPVANPSFESPQVAQTGTTITGWNVGSGVEVVHEAFSSTVITTGDGSQFVRFTGAASGGSNTLAQTITGATVSKGLYTLSFDVSDVFNDTQSQRPLTAKLVRADTGVVLGTLSLGTADISGTGNLGDAGTRKTLSCYVDEGDGAIGAPLGIRFEAGSTSGFSQVALDRVTLDLDPDAPAPVLYTLDTRSLENRTDDALAGMTGTGADGVTYSATRTGWYRNGKPWFPISGEFHYVRYAPSEWDRELAKMKACGVEVVATYVFWNHHENPQGTWDWSGQRDLRRFIQLAGRHGLKVWLRVGPYVNAEAVNGGIPSFANSGKRTNDAGYLALVNLYFQQVANQISGLCAKDGGPIVGIQLENEFASGNAAHITTLKQMAVAKGMVVPFYTVTANSRFEPGTVIPLQGAYTYRGWESAGGASASSGFIYGTDEWTANTDIGGTYYNTLDYPRGYCELGTGSPMGGNNRFMVEPKYVVATAYDSVGRGSNYLGYYMFHGGTQLPGYASGSWGTSYDFQAPLGEFGQLRDSGRLYRRLHMFTTEFADLLVPARTSRDPGQILDPTQTSRLRYIGRFVGNRGFLFLNNTQRNVVMPAQAKVRIQITTPDEVLQVPSVPLVMPADRFNVFPFRMDLGGVDLLWGTVEPMAAIRNPGELPVFVFWLPDWTNRELAFPANTGVEVEAGTADSNTSGGRLLVHVPANQRTTLRITPPGGAAATARILLLPELDSLQSVVTKVDGLKRLVVVQGADASSVNPSLRIEGDCGAQVGLDFFPASRLAPGDGWIPASAPGGWARFVRALDAAPVAPVFSSTGNGTWTIAGNPAEWQGLAHAHVRLSYKGGSAQLLSNGQELTRDLYHGDSWLIDLKRFPSQLAAGLTLRVNGWDAGINGVAQPTVAMPALDAPVWQPRREIAWNDGDDNGLRDAWEMQYFHATGQDPAADPDQDGLPNADEQDLGTDPTSADTDHDGTSDKAEARLGIDPLNPSQRFTLSLTKLVPDGWELRWPGRSNCLFKIERSDTLSQWLTLAEDWTGGDDPCRYVDHPGPSGAGCFYRVSLVR
ncbi:beta-galactosidase [Luteolibacter ambystomatis]|uniref:Beta-galactosidase n=1 Tax=Luteolibacter ambystomatis TaxID=2824561 RepID=A0A975J2T9_9BACT|nr:beta-galactosidase [Luteolibacter ambystomatis]QUE52926.1 beta-galactosidase [Luteolibacter ambystomatis]